MKDNYSKKEWEKPELVTIVRNRMEECVLAGCKTSRRGDCIKESGATHAITNS